MPHRENTRTNEFNWLLRRSLFIVLLCIGLSSFVYAEDISVLPVTVGQRVDQAVSAQMLQQQLVGVAVGIIRDATVVYTRAYGYEDRENQIPMTTQTMIRWASVSKTLTAVVAGQLAQEGMLNLHEDVRRLVPEFPDKKFLITPRDLLCHQSGIVHYSNGSVVRTIRTYNSPNPFQNVILALDTFKDSPLVYQPGTKYSYSTHAYILLSAVTQRAENRNFADQVKDRICKPLGLTTLQPDYQWVDIQNRAVGYAIRNATIQRSSNTDVSWKLGGGGFISSIDDLSKYAAGLMGTEIMSEQSKSLMWVPQKTKSGASTDVGLGFFVDGKGRQFRVAHNGSQEKAKTRMVLYPNRRDGVVVMSNSENADPGKITTAIYQAIFP